MKKLLSVLLFGVMLGAGSLFIAGCGDETDNVPYPAPRESIGMIPLQLGNQWTYRTERTEFDCSNNPLIECRSKECEYECQLAYDECVRQVEAEYAQCMAAARNDLDRSLCGLARRDKLARCEEEYARCLRDNCGPFTEDPESYFCRQGGCAIEVGLTTTCSGQTRFYPGCEKVLYTQRNIETVSAAVEWDQTVIYAMGGDRFRHNMGGGVYYRGSDRTRLYAEPVLEFKYPAKDGERYQVSFPEGGTYEVTVIDTNRMLTAEDVPAAAQDGGTFYSYEYAFRRIADNDCGCAEHFVVNVVPGIGIVKRESQHSDDRQGRNLAAERMVLLSYQVAPSEF